jgi:hypothetical protein
MGTVDHLSPPSVWDHAAAMSTVHPERRPRGTAAILLALLATFALAGPGLARDGGNSEASAACEDGGYRNWIDAEGNGFRNAGACVRHAAHGGALVPVVVNPFSVSYRASGTAGFVATVTGDGLEPGTGVDVMLVWGETAQFFDEVADENGAATLTVGGVCVSGGVPLTTVAALATPQGGVHTEFALSLPDASVCPAAG